MMSADVFGRLCARVLISRLICSSPSPSLRVRLQLCFSLSSSPVQSSTVQYGPERSRTIRSQICPVCPSRFSSLLFAGPWWRSGPERALGCPRLERYLQGLRRISRDGPMTFSEPKVQRSTVRSEGCKADSGDLSGWIKLGSGGNESSLDKQVEMKQHDGYRRRYRTRTYVPIHGASTDWTAPPFSLVWRRRRCKRRGRTVLGVAPVCAGLT